VFEKSLAFVIEQLAPASAVLFERGMPYVITQKCVGTCASACVDVCPADCIHGDGLQMFIDPDECISCGACVDECPVSAIVHLDDAEPDDRERNAGFFARRGNEPTARGV
jgi:ferredoxin